jgi:hypothetical protein
MFDIKKFYTVLTLRLCFLYGSQNKQQRLPYITSTDWFLVTEVERVYSAVRTESFNLLKPSGNFTYYQV